MKVPGAGGIFDGGFGVLFFVGDFMGSGVFVGFAGRAGTARAGFMGLGVLFGFVVAVVIGSVVFTSSGRLAVVVGFFVRLGSLDVGSTVVDVD